MEANNRLGNLWKRLRQNQVALWSLAFIVLVVLGGTLVPLISP